MNKSKVLKSAHTQAVSFWKSLISYSRKGMRSKRRGRWKSNKCIASILVLCVPSSLWFSFHASPRAFRHSLLSLLLAWTHKFQPKLMYVYIYIFIRSRDAWETFFLFWKIEKKNSTIRFYFAKYSWRLSGHVFFNIWKINFFFLLASHWKFLHDVYRAQICTSK